MKEWLRNKLKNFINNYEEATLGSLVKMEEESINSSPILYFKVFDAVGGKVVEFTRYDKKIDRRISTTYIITNDQDFGERISKISTLENLKS